MKGEEYLSVYENVEVIRDGDQLVAQFTDLKDFNDYPVGRGRCDADAIDDLAWELRQELERSRAESERMRSVLQEFVKACKECSLPKKYRRIWRMALDALKGGE